MPAPDLKTLTEVDAAIEAAVVSILSDASVTAARQRDTEEIATPHVRVQCSLGAPTGRLHTVKVAGEYRQDMWAFTLHVGIVTNRADEAQDHEDLRADVRAALWAWQAAFNSTALPYHSIARFDAAGTSPEVEDENNLDISALQYSGVVCVRAGAWPA